MILIKIVLNPTNLEEEVKKNGWKGTGSKKNPFIVENIDDLALTFKLVNLDIYITFFNCSIHSFSLKSCQKVFLNKCQAKALKLRRSYENTFKKNQLKKIVFRLSGGNTFIQNQLTKRAQHYLNKSLYFRNIPTFLLLIISVSAIIFIPYIIHSSFFGTQLATFIFLIFVYLSVIGIITIYKLFNIRWEQSNIPDDTCLKNEMVKKKISRKEDLH